MNGSDTLHNDLAPWRIIAFLIAVVVVFAIYLVRLFGLQVLEQPNWLAKAEDQRTTTINVPTLRGIIFDRSQTSPIILARNVPSYNIVITAANLPDDIGEKQRVYRELSALISVPVDQGEITKENPFVPCVSNHGIAQVAFYGENSKPYEPVRVKCDVDRTIAMIVQEKAADWPGIGVEVVSVRDYPTGFYTADVIGYLGPIPAKSEEKYRDLGFDPSRDKIGYAGLEWYFQSILGGRNGLRNVEVDVAGRVLRDIAEPVDPIPGNNLRLTIDYRLQQNAYSILVDEIDSQNRNVQYPEKIMTSGVVIVMNPKTGEILAMVSYPTYENNRLAREIPSYYYEQLTADKRLPLLNHAVGDRLPVGSVFKLVTAVGALNEGVVTPDQFIKTPGKITIMQQFSKNDPVQPKDFMDWINRDGVCPGGLTMNGTCAQQGVGELDFIHGLAFSSNVYFYKLGGGYPDEIPQGLGICRLGTYARALGYGPQPQIELPDVAEGLIPDPTWKIINQGQSWATGDTYIASVGQGFVIGTPLQVLMSAATIANDGKLMEPTIVREILDGEGNVIQPFEPHIRWDLTITPTVQVFGEMGVRGCEPTGELKTIQPWVFEKVREGMLLATTEGTLGTLAKNKPGFNKLNIAVGGKTGSAEYCDDFVKAKGLCIPERWPSHAWTVAFAPYDNPEIAVVAFVYNGNEGATVAGPIVRRVLQAYFELKAVDAELGNP